MEQSITIKGVSFPFDVMDVETARRYEAAMQTLSEEIGALDTEAMSSSEAMCSQIDIVQKCLSSILGKDAPLRIFEGRMNLREHLEAFRELYDGANAQAAAFSKETEAVFQAVPAPANKERRRTGKK